MAKDSLTDIELRRMKPPTNGRYELTDGRVPGLKFRLTSKGHASFSLQVNIGGRKRRFTIGEYPAIGLSEARKRAQRIRVEALDGRDPIKEKRQAKQIQLSKSRTVADAIDEYAMVHLKPNLKTANERERQIKAALSAHLKLPISELERRHLQMAIDAKAKSGARIAANRIRAALTAFTKWCWQRSYIEANIGAGTAIATKEFPRERVLNLNEISKILHVSYNLGQLWGPYIRILIFTAQRRGDVAGMRWSEIDLEQNLWKIPGNRTKNHRPHLVHLTPPILAELNLLKLMRGPQCDLVFTTTGKTPISGFGRMKEKLNKEMSLFDWRLHDIRTAFASALCDLGESESVVDRVLNHAASASSPSSVARVYNQSEYLTQRANALEVWANLILPGEHYDR